MKYLIEIHHGIGDVVQMTGIIETLYNSDKDADIGVIVLASNRAELLKNDSRVNDIYTINIRDSSKTNLLKEILRIRKKRYDYAFFSPISNKRDTQLLALLLGAKKNYGEQFVNLSKVSKKYHLVNKKDTHIVVRNNNLIFEAGIVHKLNAISSPKIQGLRCFNRSVFESGKIVGICIGTSEPSKTWPIEKYLKAAEQFENKGVNVVFIGGEDEKKRFPNEILCRHPRWYNYMGKEDMLGSATLTMVCDIVLGGDTGVMHMAAAVGTPTVAIFSCTDPKYHAPYSENSYVITTKVHCQYCYDTGGYSTCPEFICITGIKVPAVVKLVQDVLNGVADKKYKFIKDTD